MINIEVFSKSNVQIESKEWNIETQEQMIAFLTSVLNSAYYTGETIGLFKADIVKNHEGDCPRVEYTEINRW